MDFGEQIKSIRQKEKLTQEQFAMKLNVSRQAVSNWENNNILPSIDMLIKIARFFSVSTDFLLELDSRSFIEVDGLTIEEVAHIQQLINDIRKPRKG